MRSWKGLKAGLAIGCAVCLVLGMASTASAQNVLADPGFEVYSDWGEGPKPTGGWGFWNLTWTVDATHEHAQLPPYEGDRMEFIMGPYNGEWWGNSGVVQEFPTVPGDTWNLTVRSYIPSSMYPDWDGFGIIKIEFADGGGAPMVEGTVEMTIADEGMPANEWHTYTLEGTAPMGAVSVRALALYLQPNQWDGGGMMIDDASFILKPPPPLPAVSTWGLLVLALALAVGLKFYFGRRREVAA